MAAAVFVECAAVCQRDPNYYEHLCERDTQDDLQQLIGDFFDETVAPTFPLADYVFDVYVDQNDRVWLLSFKPFATCTDALLYTWSELLDMSSRYEAGYIEFTNVHSGARLNVIEEKDENGEQFMRVAIGEDGSFMLPITSSSSFDPSDFDFRVINNKQEEQYLPRTAAGIAKRLPIDSVHTDVSDAGGIERLSDRMLHGDLKEK